MSARFEFSHKTLSKKPRYRRKKEYVEGEEFAESVRITNVGDRPFPPVDMHIRISASFATRQESGWEFTLKSGSIEPGKSFDSHTERTVLASGFALFEFKCNPYGQGAEFQDERGQAIELSPTAFDSFHATSTLELATLAGLYFAAIGTILAAVGVILTALLR